VPRPVGLRVLNGVGGALRAAGLPLVRLDEATLVARASRETGLADFGDDRFRVPLRVLLDAFEREAALTVLGRLIARTDVVRLLANRLRMVDAHARHPEIGDGRIRAPIFVVGLPRTGTSILHELLAQDPANRVPMTWEVMHPWPPPERETYETDPRIAQVEKHFAGVDRLIPGFKTMHPMGACLPQECVALTAHDFATMLFSTTHHVPSYQAWLDDADLRWVYASHRRQLQYLQWKCPAGRWVLKSPGHLWALDALLAVTVLRSLASERIDPVAIGAEWTERLAAGLGRAMAVRDRVAAEARVFDVQFTELLRDEIGMMRRIYAYFELDLSADAEARMRRFLAENPRDKHGRHRYTLAASGLDVATERRRYAAYQERFAVPSEPVSS
jgi:hypothetical protein